MVDMRNEPNLAGYHGISALTGVQPVQPLRVTSVIGARCATHSIRYAAGQIARLAQEGTRLGQAEVDAIIQTTSVDVQRIERQLDLLLDLAFHPDGLAQFKRLSRYYFSINPAVTSQYIHAYREMWDTPSESEEKNQA